MSNKIIEGEQVPKFNILVGEEEILSPADFVGRKLIIYFYPKDNTPGCTTEAKDFAEEYEEFQKLGVEILGVSKDSLKSHTNFANKYKLPFKLGSDPEGKMCESFGVWTEKSMYGRKYMGIERSSFLIDENGKIMKIWRKVSVPQHVKEILNEVKYNEDN